MYHIDHQKYGKFTHNLITPHKNGRFMRFSDLIVHTSSYMHFQFYIGYIFVNEKSMSMQ